MHNNRANPSHPSNCKICKAYFQVKMFHFSLVTNDQILVTNSADFQDRLFVGFKKVKTWQTCEDFIKTYSCCPRLVYQRKVFNINVTSSVLSVISFFIQFKIFYHTSSSSLRATLRSLFKAS